MWEAIISSRWINTKSRATNSSLLGVTMFLMLFIHSHFRHRTECSICFRLIKKAVSKQILPSWVRRQRSKSRKSQKSYSNCKPKLVPTSDALDLLALLVRAKLSDTFLGTKIARCPWLVQQTEGECHGNRDYPGTNVAEPQISIQSRVKQSESLNYR